MRLITVSSPDRPDKVFVMGGTLSELKEAALEKLKLPPGNYEVCFDISLSNLLKLIWCQNNLSSWILFQFCRATDGVKILSDDVLQFLSDASETDGNLAVVVSAATATNPDGSKYTFVLILHNCPWVRLFPNLFSNLFQIFSVHLLLLHLFLCLPTETMLFIRPCLWGAL